MNEQFLSKLHIIESLNPDKVLQQIMAVFATISTMDRYEAISAYQSIRFFVDTWPLDDGRRIPASKLVDAIVERMLTVIEETPIEKRVAVATSFNNTVKVITYSEKLCDALDRARTEEYATARHAH